MDLQIKFDAEDFIQELIEAEYNIDDFMLELLKSSQNKFNLAWILSNTKINFSGIEIKQSIALLLNMRKDAHLLSDFAEKVTNELNRI